VAGTKGGAGQKKKEGRERWLYRTPKGLQSEKKRDSRERVFRTRMERPERKKHPNEKKDDEKL